MAGAARTQVPPHTFGTRERGQIRGLKAAAASIEVDRSEGRWDVRRRDEGREKGAMKKEAEGRERRGRRGKGRKVGKIRERARWMGKC